MKVYSIGPCHCLEKHPKLTCQGFQLINLFVVARHNANIAAKYLLFSVFGAVFPALTQEHIMSFARIDFIWAGPGQLKAAQKFCQPFQHFLFFFSIWKWHYLQSRAVAVTVKKKEWRQGKSVCVQSRSVGACVGEMSNQLQWKARWAY